MDIAQARKRRGWSFDRAVQHMRGIYEQQLRNLEGEGATRPTDPLKVSLKNALEILRAYWPDVSLDDFVGEATGFKLVPTDAARLRAHPAEVFLEKQRQRPTRKRPAKRGDGSARRRERRAG